LEPVDAVAAIRRNPQLCPPLELMRDTTLTSRLMQIKESLGPLP
jgi:hypothetical protein